MVAAKAGEFDSADKDFRSDFGLGERPPVFSSPHEIEIKGKRYLFQIYDTTGGKVLFTKWATVKSKGLVRQIKSLYDDLIDLGQQEIQPEKDTPAEVSEPERIRVRVAAGAWGIWRYTNFSFFTIGAIEGYLTWEFARSILTQYLPQVPLGLTSEFILPFVSVMVITTFILIVSIFLLHLILGALTPDDTKPVRNLREIIKATRTASRSLGGVPFLAFGLVLGSEPISFLLMATSLLVAVLLHALPQWGLSRKMFYSYDRLPYGYSSNHISYRGLTVPNISLTKEALVPFLTKRASGQIGNLKDLDLDNLIVMALRTVGIIKTVQQLGTIPGEMRFPELVVTIWQKEGIKKGDMSKGRAALIRYLAATGHSEEKLNRMDLSRLFIELDRRIKMGSDRLVNKNAQGYETWKKGVGFWHAYQLNHKWRIHEAAKEYLTGHQGEHEGAVYNESEIDEDINRILALVQSTTENPYQAKRRAEAGQTLSRQFQTPSPPSSQGIVVVIDTARLPVKKINYVVAYSGTEAEMVVMGDIPPQAIAAVFIDKQPFNSQIPIVNLRMIPGALGLWRHTKLSFFTIGAIEGFFTWLFSWGLLTIIMPQGPPYMGL